MAAGKQRHSHAEAFCLMNYICEDCGHHELIWNSRDGVTPFVARCRECQGAMVHKDWSSDKYAPDHIPEPGQFIWIDMPDSLKRPVALGRIRAMEDDFPLRDEEIPEVVESIVEGFKEGTPWLIRWPG
jgi:hypothetical protein